MARTKGSIKLSSNFEPEAGAPFDARTIVPALADLTTAGTFPYPYEGMIVYVQATHDTYQYIGGTITDSASWKKFGSNSESGNNDSQESHEFGVKKLYIGNAGGDTSAGIAYEDVYKECTYPADSYPNGTYYEIINNEYVPAVTPPYTEDQFSEIEARLNDFEGGELTVEEYESMYGTTPTADGQTLNLMRNFNNYKTFYQKSLPRYTIPEALHGKGEDVIVKIYDLADVSDIFNEKVYDDYTYKIATDKSTKYSKGDIIIQLGQYDYEIQIWGHEYIPDASEFPNLLFTKTETGKSSVQKSSTFNTDTIIIPEKIRLNGEVLNVTSIPTEGFVDCSGLVTALLPNSLETIGSAAFKGCSTIKTMSLPFVGERRYAATDTYQYPLGYIFGTTSFTGATKTYQRYWGTAVGNRYNISGGYYYLPTSIRNIIITGTEYLQAGSFDSCTVENLKIESNITSLETFVFFSCRNLKYIKLPNTITQIKDGAFMYCSSLTSFEVSENVTSIGGDAFYNCDKLKIYIPSSVTTLGNRSFTGTDTIYFERASADPNWGDGYYGFGWKPYKAFWNYKSDAAYTLTYYYGPDSEFSETFKLNAGDTIPEFERVLGEGGYGNNYGRGEFSEDDFSDYSYEDSESWTGYNFSHWENPAGQTVTIPSVMPSSNLEFYAAYDEYYFEGYAMDEGM